MRQCAFAGVFFCLFTLILISSCPGAKAGPAFPQRVEVENFFNSLVGDWVGTYEEVTNGEKAETRYFRAVIKQPNPASCETVFEYYRFDRTSNSPVKVGASSIITCILPDGTGQSTTVGDGQVKVDDHTLQPEKHRITEVLRWSPGGGGLEGRGQGSINVSGVAMNLGKNGKILDYRSTCSQSDGILKMSRQFRIKFKVLCFSKSYNVKTDFVARPGRDLAGLTKSLESKAGPEKLSASSR
jgi:hypothetical protein